MAFQTALISHFKLQALANKSLIESDAAATRFRKLKDCRQVLSGFFDGDKQVVPIVVILNMPQ